LLKLLSIIYRIIGALLLLGSLLSGLGALYLLFYPLPPAFNPFNIPPEFNVPVAFGLAIAGIFIGATVYAAGEAIQLALNLEKHADNTDRLLGEINAQLQSVSSIILNAKFKDQELASRIATAVEKLTPTEENVQAN